MGAGLGDQGARWRFWATPAEPPTLADTVKITNSRAQVVNQLSPGTV